MGTNVNQLIGADPELYRQQLIQQEQQRIGALPAQQQLGAQLGSLLGRGITNVAQGQGFFQVTNPVLQRLTSIQEAYNTAMQKADPADPASLYTELEKELQSRNLGQQAIMARQEAMKFREAAIGIKSKELDLFSKNPELLTEEITKAQDAGDEKRVAQLTTMQTRITDKLNRERIKEEAQIDLLGAQTEAQKAQARKIISDLNNPDLKVNIVPDSVTGGATVIVVDPKTGKEVNSYKTGGLGGAGAVAPAAAGKDEKKPKADPAAFDRTRQNPPAAAPAANPNVQTSWSGVQTQVPPAAPRSAEDQLNLALQRAYPQVPFSNILQLNPEQKQVLAKQAGIL